MTKKPPRWVIRVVTPTGVAWLRHGPISGTGKIVRFTSKKTADINLEMIQPGLEEGWIAQVVRVADGPSQEQG